MIPPLKIIEAMAMEFAALIAEAENATDAKQLNENDLEAQTTRYVYRRLAEHLNDKQIEAVHQVFDSAYVKTFNEKRHELSEE